jgi:outer membrane protein assembly factor BamB
MAALDRMTGETVWTCKGAGDRPGYASPILVDYDGLKQIVTVMSESVVGVRASDGKLLWRYPHKVYADENITTPLFHDGYVIVSGCVRKGTTSLELQVSGNECSVEMHWHNQTLDNKQGGIVCTTAAFTATRRCKPGRDRGCALTSSPEKPCFSLPRLESTYKYKNGCLTYADGMFYLYADNGNMVLARPTDSGFEVTGRLTVEDPGERPTWAHPVVFDGTTLRPLW